MSAFILHVIIYRCTVLLLHVYIFYFSTMCTVSLLLYKVGNRHSHTDVQNDYSNPLLHLHVCGRGLIIISVIDYTCIYCITTVILYSLSCILYFCIVVSVL